MWSLFWSILVCKIPQFWAKATDSDSPSYFFLESRHPEVTKNPYDILYPKGSQKKVSAYGLSLMLAVPKEVKSFAFLVSLC